MALCITICVTSCQKDTPEESALKGLPALNRRLEITQKPTELSTKHLVQAVDAIPTVNTATDLSVETGDLVKMSLETSSIEPKENSPTEKSTARQRISKTTSKGPVSTGKQILIKSSTEVPTSLKRSTIRISDTKELATKGLAAMNRRLEITQEPTGLTTKHLVQADNVIPTVSTATDPPVETGDLAKKSFKTSSIKPTENSPTEKVTARRRNRKTTLKGSVSIGKHILIRSSTEGPTSLKRSTIRISDTKELATKGLAAMNHRLEITQEPTGLTTKHLVQADDAIPTVSTATDPPVETGDLAKKSIKTSSIKPTENSPTEKVTARRRNRKTTLKGSVSIGKQILIRSSTEGPTSLKRSTIRISDTKELATKGLAAMNRRLEITQEPTGLTTKHLVQADDVTPTVNTATDLSVETGDLAKKSLKTRFTEHPTTQKSTARQRFNKTALKGSMSTGTQVQQKPRTPSSKQSTPRITASKAVKRLVDKASKTATTLKTTGEHLPKQPPSDAGTQSVVTKSSVEIQGFKNKSREKTGVYLTAPPQINASTGTQNVVSGLAAEMVFNNKSRETTGERLTSPPQTDASTGTLSAVTKSSAETERFKNKSRETTRAHLTTTPTYSSTGTQNMLTKSSAEIKMFNTKSGETKSTQRLLTASVDTGINSTTPDQLAETGEYVNSSWVTASDNGSNTEETTTYPWRSHVTASGSTTIEDQTEIVDLMPSTRTSTPDVNCSTPIIIPDKKPTIPTDYINAVIIIVCLTITGCAVLSAFMVFLCRKRKEYSVASRRTSSYVNFDYRESELYIPTNTGDFNGGLTFEASRRGTGTNSRETTQENSRTSASLQSTGGNDTCIKTFAVSDDANYRRVVKNVRFEDMSETDMTEVKGVGEDTKPSDESNSEMNANPGFQPKVAAAVDDSVWPGVSGVVHEDMLNKKGSEYDFTVTCNCQYRDPVTSQMSFKKNDTAALNWATF